MNRFVAPFGFGVALYPLDDIDRFQRLAAEAHSVAPNVKQRFLATLPGAILVSF